MNRNTRPTLLAAAGCLMLPLIGVVTGLETSASVTLPTTASAGAVRRWHDPYVAEWSNGRGDTLVITSSTIKFGNDKPVPYHDVTRVTNGREFSLEITADTKLNYLTRFLHISFGDGDKTDEMKMTLYNSRKDLDDGDNPQGEATWQRDK